MKKILSFVLASFLSAFAFADACPQVVSGHGEASSYNRTYVTLPCQMPSGSYSVVVTPNEFNNANFYSEGKSANGFTVGAVAQGVGNANRFDWIAVRN